MAREWLGAFGRGMSDSDLGAALAWQSLRFANVDARGRSVPGMPSPFAPGWRRAGRSDAGHMRRRWLAQVADVRRKATPTRHGIAIGTYWDSTFPSDSFREYLELLAAGEGVSAAHVVTAPGQPSVAWLWPLDVAVLDDPLSVRFREALDDLLFRRFVKSVRAATATEPIAILALPQSLEEALQAVAAAPRPPRVQTVIVLGGVGAVTDPIATAERLRAAARADAVVVVEAPADDGRLSFLDSVLRELARDIDLDVAFTVASRERGLRAPLLVAAEGGFARAHASAWSTALASRLARAQDVTMLPVNKLLPTETPEESVFRFVNSLLDVWNRENDDASTMAILSESVREAPIEERTRERRVQAQLLDRQRTVVTHEPLRDREYRLDVWIGEPLAHALRAPVPFPESALPPSNDGFDLAIVVTSPNAEIVERRQRVRLPASGASDRASFDLRIPDGQKRVEVRVAVLHEGRILQTLFLSASVGGGARRELSLELEGVVRRDLDGVGGRRPFDAALLFNDFGDGPSLSVYSGSDVSLVETRRIDQQLATIASILEDATNRPENHGTPDKKLSSDLLARLARQGSALFEELLDMPDVQDALREAKRIQVVSKRGEQPLPLEIVYVAAPPVEGARVCKEWREALASDSRGCSGKCPADKREVVCPVAFWGTSIVIERHQYSKETARRVGPDDFAVFQREPSGRRRLSLAGTSVCAAATNARAVDPSAVDEAFAAAAEAVGAPEPNEVKRWADWKGAVRAGSARLLVLLAHTEMKGTDQALVIHEKEAELLTSIGNEHVGVAGQEPPVVLLLGCSTAAPTDGFAQFTTKFRRAGAALVVGTLCKILGRHSGAIAKLLIEKLSKANRKPEPTPFGELLRDVRRQMVAEGYPIVFAVTAFGDADWLV